MSESLALLMSQSTSICSGLPTASLRAESASEGQIYHQTNLKNMIYATVNAVFGVSFYLKCLIVHRVQMIWEWLVPEGEEPFSAQISLWI